MHMKSLLLALMAAIAILSQTEAGASEPVAAAKTTYLLIYRAGPAWPQGKLVSELPLREHGNYMLSLYSKGIMKLAGPLTDNAGGAVVFEASSESEAREIVANDPAVKSGIFIHELHPWAPVQWEQRLKK
jgi:uncharacterized protein YciI